ncbi:MAG: molybdenum cofactor biosynthesis protein B [Halarchaeum sp.]
MVDFQSREKVGEITFGDDEDASADADDGGDDHEEEKHAHDHHAHDVDAVGFGVVTVSSSQEAGDDPSGDLIVERLRDAGHEVVTRDLVIDDFDRVQGTVDRLTRREEIDAVVTTGGTGVTPDDVTVEAVRPLLDKRLPGFGELFRRLSYDEVGTRVVGTRADAGVASGAPVFCLPGSENAARLGVEEIILSEVGHLVGLATRPPASGEARPENDANGDSDERDATDDAE